MRERGTASNGAGEPFPKEETSGKRKVPMSTQIDGLKEQLAARDAEIAALRAQIARSEVERNILTEGCALIREVGSEFAPVVAKTTRLNETIYKVMRSPEEMQKEIDRRIADPLRSWWNLGSGR